MHQEEEEGQHGLSVRVREVVGLKSQGQTTRELVVYSSAVEFVGDLRWGQTQCD
jgi:hypothetical protein